MTSKTKLLIVDDDETVRLSYRRSLGNAAWDIATARDGDEALQSMQQRPSDVVFLDMRMPGKSGLAVLGSLKRQWPESEVVVITGYPTLDDAKAAMRLGACDYVGKPVGPQEIAALADAAVLRKSWTARRLPDGAGPDGERSAA